MTDKARRGEVQAIEPEAERSQQAVEREKERALSAHGKGRICPHCMKPTLKRSRLPTYLRWLRLFGYNIKAYQCAFCGRLSIIRQSAGTEATASRSRSRSR